MINNKLINDIAICCVDAGIEIMKIYNDSDKMDIQIKGDGSPLTAADKKANQVILDTLNKYPYPIISEECKQQDYSERKSYTTFWLVDPLDGTKEFIKKNDEFTVNIALVENGISILGFVYVPVFDELYIGGKDIGAYKISNAISKMQGNLYSDIGNKVKLPLYNDKIPPLKVVASRSHLNENTTQFIDSLKEEYKDIELVSKGSSLKICILAEGKAHIYPRFAPTMEWDTGASHAILNASGGEIIDANTKKELCYNKEILKNPEFIGFSYCFRG